MKFPKTIADNWSDAIVVESEHGNVYVHNRDVPTDHDLGLKVDYSFSPEAARKFARALKKAADIAEAEA